MIDFEKMLQNPPKKYRPVPFWSWNEKLDVVETKKQIRQMDDAGMGGFFMHARGGLQTEYLSDEWFDNVRASLEEGEAREMFAWGYDENGWPSGFGSGAVNALGRKYQQKYLRCVEVKEPTQDEFTLSNVVVGDKIYHCYFDVNPFYVDTLNSEVIGDFLKSTHEKYREKLKDNFKKMKGFFTDEPQASRNGFPWSFHLEEVYEETYGESIREHLPKLFYRFDGYEKFRFRYWQLVRDLFTDGFMGTIGKWCHNNGTELTGHMVLEEDYYDHILANGCCMPSYEFMDIPGMDHLCREMPSVQTEMQLSSVAHQLGKKQILSETFAACGWNISFEDMRRLYEHQMVHGINLLCQHLEGYSLRGLRKRDYPASIFRHQPWWKDAKVFNDMVSRIGMLLADGAVDFPILVLHTIESGWLVTDNREEADGYAKKLNEVMNALEDMQLQYHLGESRIIKRHGSVEDGKFRIGTQHYSVVIVPPASCMDAYTFQLLRDFKKQGGTVIFTEEIPTYINGIQSEHVKDFASMCEVVAIRDLEKTIPACCLSFSAHVEDERQKPLLRTTVRHFPEQKMRMYYLCNFDEKASCVTMQTQGKSAKIFDAVSGEILPCAFETHGEHIQMRVHIPPAGSVIYFVYDKEMYPSVQNRKVENKASLSGKLKGEWQVVAADANSLTIDTCDLYVNGKLHSENMPVSDVQEILCDYREAVEAKMVYHFTIKELAFSTCELMIETPEIFAIFVNQQKVEKKITGYQHDSCFQTIDIYQHLKEGENEISLSCDFMQSEATYKMLDEIKYFISIKNRLTYDMEIEAIYLKGDFGVFTDEEFEELERNAVRTKGNFYLKKQPKIVKDGCLEMQGFPFFAGAVTLRKKITLTSDEKDHAMIHFSKQPSIVTDVKVNGVLAEKIMWRPYSLDIAPFAKLGENEICVTLTGSLRNLLGPFHLDEGETHMALPFYFFHKTSIWGWGDGTNRKWVDDYAFVQNGLFFK